MTRRSRLEKGAPRAHVELSAIDAHELGLKDGDAARVSTRRGEVVVVARVVDILAGVAWMPFHYAEAPANRLTNDAVDPECGITELKACAARVERA
jgi:formate dehydrogenase major subunit